MYYNYSFCGRKKEVNNAMIWSSYIAGASKFSREEEELYLSATLHHEAGHAVVCIIRQVPFSKIRLVDFLNANIDVEPREWDKCDLTDTEVLKKLFDYLVAMVAGVIAGSKQFEGVLLEAAEDDLCFILCWSKLLRDSGFGEDIFQRALCEAMQYLNDHWLGIQKVANALGQSKDQTLPRSDVAKIFVASIADISS